MVEEREGFKEWEAHLDRRERKLENNDGEIARMMKDLRIRKDEIVSKDAEIKDLKSEIEERVSRAREDHDREFKVVKVILVCE